MWVRFPRAGDYFSLRCGAWCTIIVLNRGVNGALMIFISVPFCFFGLIMEWMDGLRPPLLFNTGSVEQRGLTRWFLSLVPLCLFEKLEKYVTWNRVIKLEWKNASLLSSIIMPGCIFMRKTMMQIFRWIFYFHNINVQMFDNNLVTQPLMTRWVCKNASSRRGAGINFLSFCDVYMVHILCAPLLRDYSP